MALTNTNELKSITYVDSENFPCNNGGGCNFEERTLSYALGVVLPEPNIDPDIIFKECCYKHFVFADMNSSQDYKNDYSSFYHQKQVPNENATFKLVKLSDETEYDLNNGTYGVHFPFGAFPTNPKLTGYLVQWKKVLQELGEGPYQIHKTITIVGIDYVFKSLVFNLKQYSTLYADGTIRMDIVMNGRLVNGNLDFTGTGWKDSLRMGGFFGRREPKLEEDNLITRNYEKNQISMKQNNEFKFQSDMIPSCVTNKFWDFMIFSNDIYMNDYNLNNHSYDYIKYPVKFQANEGTGYLSTSRKARLNLVFTDKKENNIKRNFS